MPKPFPLEFRRDVIAVARQGEQPIAQVAKSFGVSESCLSRWMTVDDVVAGRTEGTTSDEHAELVRLRRELRVAKIESEILERASAYFAGRWRARQSAADRRYESTTPTVYRIEGWAKACTSARL